LRCRHLLIGLLDPPRQPWGHLHRGLDQALDLRNERVLLRGTEVEDALLVLGIRGSQEATRRRGLDLRVRGLEQREEHILLQLLARLLLLSLTLLGAGAGLGEAAKEIGEEWHG
jgi:hypothetical protein